MPDAKVRVSSVRIGCPYRFHFLPSIPRVLWCFPGITRELYALDNRDPRWRLPPVSSSAFVTLWRGETCKPNYNCATQRSPSGLSRLQPFLLAPATSLQTIITVLVMGAGWLPLRLSLSHHRKPWPQETRQPGWSLLWP